MHSFPGNLALITSTCYPINNSKTALDCKYEDAKWSYARHHHVISSIYIECDVLQAGTNNAYKLLIGSRNGHCHTWIIIVSSIDYGHVDPSEARPMPPEIAAMLTNKSEVDIEMEDCMKDFAECMGTNAFRNVEICASNTFGQIQTFATMCDMFYENCKGSATWGYFQDDACKTK